VLRLAHPRLLEQAIDAVPEQLAEPALDAHGAQTRLRGHLRQRGRMGEVGQQIVARRHQALPLRRGGIGPAQVRVAGLEKQPRQHHGLRFADQPRAGRVADGRAQMLQLAADGERGLMQLFAAVAGAKATAGVQ